MIMTRVRCLIKKRVQMHHLESCDMIKLTAEE